MPYITSASNMLSRGVQGDLSHAWVHIRCFTNTLLAALSTNLKMKLIFETLHVMVINT